jgi:hypothetical protein
MTKKYPMDTSVMVAEHLSSFMVKAPLIAHNVAITIKMRSNNPQADLIAGIS